MKGTLKAIGCMALVLLLASCDSGTENETTDATDIATVAGVDTDITEENKELLAYAARNNMLQIELGRLAIAQGTSDNVKAFGQDLVDWYTTKQQELQELAQQYNVTLPQQLENEQTEHLEEIRGAEAGEFDEEYWESVVNAQKEAIDQYDDELNEVTEADATAFTLWARNTVKELRAQLTQAEAYQLELKNRDGGITESI